MDVVVYTDAVSPTADVATSTVDVAAPTSTTAPSVDAQPIAEPVEEATEADRSSAEPMDTGDAGVPPILDDIQREVEEWHDALSRLGRVANHMLNRLVGRTNMPCPADSMDLGALNARVQQLMAQLAEFEIARRAVEREAKVLRTWLDIYAFDRQSVEARLETATALAEQSAELALGEASEAKAEAEAISAKKRATKAKAIVIMAKKKTDEAVELHRRVNAQFLDLEARLSSV